MKLCQLASGQCFSVRPYAETGFNNKRTLPGRCNEKYRCQRQTSTTFNNIIPSVLPASVSDGGEVVMHTLLQQGTESGLGIETIAGGSEGVHPGGLNAMLDSAKGSRYTDPHLSLSGVRKPSSKAGHDCAGTGWDRSGLKVLVAEDDELCRSFLIRLLRSLGVLYIHGVDNGLEAMRAVRRENFTHVFLDLVLPCIDGGARQEWRSPRPRKL